MSTKMKGLLKGLRYISQIFEEDKDQDMQIGFPTDVKHVAHIGWDGPGPSVDSPSWMKEFKSPKEFQSGPLGSPGTREGSEMVSEDSRRGSRGSHSSELPEMPRSSRRHSSTDGGATGSPRKKDSKSRQSRRHQSKDASSDGSHRSNRQPQEPSISTDSPPRSGLPDIPKKSRRKKSKETESGGGSTRSRSNKESGGGGGGGGGGTSDNANGTYPSPFSDPGSGSGSISGAPISRLSSISSVNDQVDEQRVATSKEF